MPNTVESPSPVPLPCSLVVKNRLEDPISHLERHPLAGIGEREHHVRPGVDVGVLCRIGGVDVDVAGFDQEAAAVGHGVAGVGREVHHDLLELRAVGLEAAEARRREQGQLDALADQALQHLLHAEQDRVQIDHRRLEDLLAPEGEQLAGQLACPLTCQAHFLEIEADRVAGLELVERHLGVTEHHRQQVVEVVRDAAGQATDGLELLGLAEPLLDALAFGDAQRQVVEQDVERDREARRGILQRRLFRQRDARVRLARRGGLHDPRKSRRRSARDSRGILPERACPRFPPDTAPHEGDPRALGLAPDRSTIVPKQKMVGASGFEPPTPRPPVWCANQAALRPEGTIHRRFWGAGCR